MALIIAILLGVAALAFVLYPLYRREAKVSLGTSKSEQLKIASVVAGKGDATHLMQTSSEVVAEQEQSARTALQEVEFDYQLGNIEEPDYQELRERYMRRALLALKSRYVREQEIDDEIEVQLHKLKETREIHEEADH
jgi:hypothetical protein